MLIYIQGICARRIGQNKHKHQMAQCILYNLKVYLAKPPDTGIMYRSIYTWMRDKCGPSELFTHESIHAEEMMATSDVKECSMNQPLLTWWWCCSVGSVVQSIQNCTVLFVNSIVTIAYYLKIIINPVIVNTTELISSTWTTTLQLLKVATLWNSR